MKYLIALLLLPLHCLAVGYYVGLGESNVFLGDNFTIMSGTNVAFSVSNGAVKAVSFTGTFLGITNSQVFFYGGNTNGSNDLIYLKTNASTNGILTGQTNGSYHTWPSKYAGQLVISTDGTQFLIATTNGSPDNAVTFENAQVFFRNIGNFGYYQGIGDISTAGNFYGNGQGISNVVARTLSTGASVTNLTAVGPFTNGLFVFVSASNSAALTSQYQPETTHIWIGCTTNVSAGFYVGSNTTWKAVSHL